MRRRYGFGVFAGGLLLALLLLRALQVGRERGEQDATERQAGHFEEVR